MTSDQHPQAPRDAAGILDRALREHRAALDSLTASHATALESLAGDILAACRPPTASTWPPSWPAATATTAPPGRRWP